MNEIPDRPSRVECSECQRKMAPVRTDASPIAWLFRFECVACPATGTVEVRTENSIAAQSPLINSHGAAVVGDEPVAASGGEAGG